uniref:G-protein coupled receptors family 3 profile domain-containing protein n=1 Tax=Leptobrachium leishanense TaxID=445787 RepID=A0A8C5MN37_9ANUR
ITHGMHSITSLSYRFHLENFQQFQALVFAVEEINKNDRILPNITLGFLVYDSCAVLHQDLDGALQLLTGGRHTIPNYRCLQHVPLSAVIGPSISTHSILLAQILGLYRYPQISHFSTSPLLSRRKAFPSFFRTVPSDVYQAHGLSQLVIYFGWTWVGLLAVDNDYGLEGLQLVKQELVKAGVCVAFSENIIMSQSDRNAPRIVQVIKKSKSTVVVVFSNDIDFFPVLEEMVRQNITEKTFIASEAWSTSTLLSKGRVSSLLSGTIGLALHSGEIAGFRTFLSKVHPDTSLGRDWAKWFWEETFQCRFLDGNTGNLTKQCTGVEHLDNSQGDHLDSFKFRVTYNVYASIHIVANALNNLKNCKNGAGPFMNGNCADILRFKPYQVIFQLREVQLGGSREIYFDGNGDPPAAYDIVNWRFSPNGSLRHAMVGSYNAETSLGQMFTIKTNEIAWATYDGQVPVSVCSPSCPPGFRKAPKRGEPACCFQCVPCPQGEISNQTDSTDCCKCPWDMWPNPPKTKCVPKLIEYLSYEDPLGMALTSISIASALVPVAILKLFMTYKRTPIVKANNYSLSCLLLVFLSLCFLCSLTFIGYPQREKCLLRQVAFGVVFALCISCILAKTIMVVIAFMATKPDSSLKKLKSPSVPNIVIFLCTLLQVILCATWLVFSAPFPEPNIRTYPGLIVAECNEGHPAAFWSMLGYLGLLATISFIVAFMARRLPDSFNEAKYITFSMLAFLSVWTSYIPASLSAKGKFTVAMEIFAIQSSSWALVICMFCPKCFIILFQPDRNSKEHLMGKRSLMYT